MGKFATLAFGLLYGMSIRFCFECHVSHTSSVLEQQQQTPHPSLRGFYEAAYYGTTTIAGEDYPFQPEKLVIAMIAIGENQQAQVQRLIQSARSHGNYQGPIAVVTDSKDDYQTLIDQDSLVYTCEQLPVSDNHDSITMPLWEREQIQRTRSKTLLLDTLSSCNAATKVQQAEFVLYLDVDQIITQPFVPWLQEKWQQGSDLRHNVYADLSSLYMFPNDSASRRSAHTDVMLLHKTLSWGCLRKWQSLMQRYSDFAALDEEFVIRIIMASPGPMQCKIRTWDAAARHDFLLAAEQQ